MAENKQILSPEVAEKKLRRMAFEIVERNAGEPSIILAGIRENGYIIAMKLHTMLKEIFDGLIEVTGIRLDKRLPKEIILDREMEVNNKVVILIDDVANSGRTMLYAIKPFLEHQPKKIQTLVLVERTHKAFPVNADYVGLSIATTLHEHIVVEVDGDEISGAWLQ